VVFAVAIAVAIAGVIAGCTQQSREAAGLHHRRCCSSGRGRWSSGGQACRRLAVLICCLESAFGGQKFCSRLLVVTVEKFGLAPRLLLLTMKFKCLDVDQSAWGELTTLELLTRVAVSNFLDPRASPFLSGPQERRTQTRLGTIGPIAEDSDIEQSRRDA
jgi:hypothetical protein